MHIFNHNYAEDLPKWTDSAFIPIIFIMITIVIIVSQTC